MSEVNRFNNAIELLNEIIHICRSEYDDIIYVEDTHYGFPGDYTTCYGNNIIVNLRNECMMKGDRELWTADISIKNNSKVKHMVDNLDYDTLRDLYSRDQNKIDELRRKSMMLDHTIFDEHIVVHRFRITDNDYTDRLRVDINEEIDDPKFLGCYCEAAMMFLADIPCIVKEEEREYRKYIC